MSTLPAATAGTRDVASPACERAWPHLETLTSSDLLWQRGRRGEEGAIDEFRLMLSPQALGAGVPLFGAPIQLDLVEARPFRSGNVLLRYAPQRQ